MSKKTNFKRVALVAVAALGLGVLSSVPSQATFNADYLTVTAETASQKIGETYTSTVPTVKVGFLADTASVDSMTITASLVSGPATSSALASVRVIETSNATVASGGSARAEGYAAGSNTKVSTEAVAAGQASATYGIYLSVGDRTTAPTVAGTYVVRITPTLKVGAGTAGLDTWTGVSTYKDVTITVAALDNTATTLSTFFIQGTSGYAAGATTDSAVSALSTA